MLIYPTAMGIYPTWDTDWIMFADKKQTIKAGWWYTYASEKHESHVFMMKFPTEWKNNTCSSHQPDKSGKRW